ncbi:hypothetical protein KIPB_017337, partial [Kipferlia bialata]
VEETTTEDESKDPLAQEVEGREAERDMESRMVQDIARDALKSLSLRWGPYQKGTHGKSNRYFASTLLSAGQVLQSTYNPKEESKDLRDIR